MKKIKKSCEQYFNMIANQPMRLPYAFYIVYINHIAMNQDNNKKKSFSYYIVIGFNFTFI